MEDREASSLLERYRRDRRNLLEFLLSSGLVELRTPSLSHIDFDNLSADCVLDRLLSGGVVDVSEAIKKYLNKLAYPVTIHSKSGTSYFSVSEPESVGSRPWRAPPPIEEKRTIEKVSTSSRQMDSSNVENTATAGDDYGLRYKATPVMQTKTVQCVRVPLLGLPNLRTGPSDDDLRKSAYEILLASIVHSGVEICVVEEKKKEKNAKFLLGLKNKKEKTHAESHSLDGHSQLICTIRLQMQIASTVDLEAKVERKHPLCVPVCK